MLGTIGIIIALALIIYMAYKGFSVFFLAPILTAFVIAMNGQNVIAGMFTAPTANYMMKVVGFFGAYWPYFLLGSVFGKLMEDSGAAYAVAKWVMSKMGADSKLRALIAIGLVGAILSYGGISMFVIIFAMYPLARPIFREMNMPWHLVMIPMIVGTSTFTVSMLPGTPSVQNIIPMKVLGTSLTAAPLLGIIASVVAIVLGIIYAKYAIQKAEEAGETYVVTAADSAANQFTNAPSTFIAFLPILILLIILLPGSFKNVPNIVYYGMTIAIVVAMICYKSNIKNYVTTINAGAANSVLPCATVSVVVGFGSMLALMPPFQVFLKSVLGISDPILSLTALMLVYTGFTASTAGALGIFAAQFASHYLSTGLAPEAIHRIAAITAGGFSCLPFSGALLASFMVAGLTHKDAYKHALWSGLILYMVVSIVTILCAEILY